MTDTEPVTEGTDSVEDPSATETVASPLKPEHVSMTGSTVVRAAERGHRSGDGSISLPRGFPTRVQGVEPRQVAGQTHFVDTEVYMSD